MPSTTPIHSLHWHIASRLTDDDPDITIAAGTTSGEIAGHQIAQRFSMRNTRRPIMITT